MQTYLHLLVATSIAAIVCSGVTASYAQQSPVAVTVNGDVVAFTGQPPVSQNGRLLVPLRGVLEKIGATVRYSGPTKSIQATKGDINIALTLGETNATVSGRNVTLDVPAQAVNGTTLVPLRFVAESLGADVKYDGGQRIVAIRTDGKPNVIVAVPKTQTPPVATTPQTPEAAKTITGVFVDFDKIPQQSDATVTLKMTDGQTLTFRQNAELTYLGQKIAWDDLRSGDKVVATVNKNGRATRASISDDD